MTQSKKKIDLVLSFDTTGSMSGAIADVRKNLTQFCNHLFGMGHDLRVSVIAHGDYGDGLDTFQHLPFCAEAERVTRVQTAHAVGAVRDAEATKAEASKAVADAEWEYRQLVPVIEGLRAKLRACEAVVDAARGVVRGVTGGRAVLAAAVVALDEATTTATKGATT